MPAGSWPGKEVTEDGLAEVQGNPVTTLPPPPQTVACNDEAVHESGTESDESILSGMPDSGDASTAMHHVKSDTHACPDSGLGKVLSGKSLLESRHAEDELDAVSRGLRVGTVAGGAHCSVSVDSAQDLSHLYDVSDRQSDDMAGGGRENVMLFSSACGTETAGTGTEEGAGAAAAAGFEVMEPYCAQETRHGATPDAVASVSGKVEKQEPGERGREGGAGPGGYGEDDAEEQSNAGDDGVDEGSAVAAVGTVDEVVNGRKPAALRGVGEDYASEGGGGEREGRIDGTYDGQMNAVKAPQGSGENGIKEIFGWTECEADGVALDHRSKTDLHAWMLPNFAFVSCVSLRHPLMQGFRRWKQELSSDTRERLKDLEALAFADSDDSDDSGGICLWHCVFLFCA